MGQRKINVSILQGDTSS